MTFGTAMVPQYWLLSLVAFRLAVFVFVYETQFTIIIVIIITIRCYVYTIYYLSNVSVHIEHKLYKINIMALLLLPLLLATVSFIVLHAAHDIVIYI